MTNKIEMVSVERELLVTANVCVMRAHDLLVGQMKITDHRDEYRAEIARLKDTHEQLKHALLAAPAVERQPVAWIKHLKDAECKSNGQTYDVMFCPMDGYQPLFDSPPAPVVVGLPARRYIFDKDYDDEDRTYSMGWNACLDKAKAPNP